MAIISTTLCYPNSAVPTQGIFVQRRLREIAKFMPVKVIAPVPWFPVIAPARFNLRAAMSESPPVSYPRMYYLPGVFKRFDARFYARALLRGIEDVRGPDRIELIDAHFEWPDGVGGYLAARKLGVPFVCTLRGKLVSQIKYPERRKRIREMLVGADALIAVSKSLAVLAREVAERDLPIHVIPNGIDSAIFNYHDDTAAARRACGWDMNARYVVSVGHLQELKGFHRLIEAWPEVRRRMGDVRLILVGGSAGEPHYEQRLRAEIESSNLKQVIILTGRVEPARVAAMLNATDLFVLTSRSEGWCNALAEALACGCPVLATDVGGNAEIVNASGLGRLIPLDDLTDIPLSICNALEATWDRATIAEVGGRRSWQQVAVECVRVFRELLSK